MDRGDEGVVQRSPFARALEGDVPEVRDGLQLYATAALVHDLLYVTSLERLSRLDHVVHLESCHDRANTSE